MSKRQMRMDESFSDAILFADMDEDEQNESFVRSMERRSARRKMRARRAAQDRFDSSSERKWLHGRVADWDDYQD